MRSLRALAGLLAIVAVPGSLGFAQEPDPAFSEISPAAADSLGLKIDAIRSVEYSPERRASQESFTVSDVEMESFVLYWMVDEIPPRVESIDVTVEDGLISTDAELTLDEEHSSGNAVVDGLLGGTHRLRIGGALKGQDGMGEFELREVRLDGIRIPLFLVDLIVAGFVTPRYPEVDLDEPFDLPWGIDEIQLTSGLATIGY